MDRRNPAHNISRSNDFGEMSEVILLDSTPIVRHQKDVCVTMRGRLTFRPDCASIESRCSVDEALPLPKPLFHLARGLGRGSSAASKYYEIFCEEPLSKIYPNLIVSLTDGCGVACLEKKIEIGEGGVRKSCGWSP